MRLAALVVIIGSLSITSSVDAGDQPLQISTFKIDVTPPLGSALCNGNVTPALEITTPLTARGIVLIGAGDPIVLCAVDWVGIGNESYDAFREALAGAVGSTSDRVALHALHQHDAPGSDFATERLLSAHGLAREFSNPDFDAEVMDRLARAAKESLAAAQPVTHIGLGSGQVEKVASNRRILGPDGRVAIQRQSSGAKNPAARDAPEGTIDPLVRLIAFWNDDDPLAVMTYYATHPQSYYGQGSVNWDFVGMARETREQAIPGLRHVHFNGAGGNIAAGKYNDGSRETRPLLAQRLAEGMRLAWESQDKLPVTAEEVDWIVRPVSLPVRDSLRESELLQKLEDASQTRRVRLRAARDLVFVRRMENGHRIPLSCLKLGPARVLHLPGELFVEYQIAAQQMRPDSFVAVAAYGDYGPGYIGTEIAYSQGGYETGIVSRVAPQVETVLVNAMQELLEVDSDDEQARRDDSESGSDRPPNMLLITCDNLGYGDLACFNPASEVISPNLDRLAAEGARLTSFYTASPTCTVSRACLLTGRIAQRHGLLDQLPGVEGNYGVGLDHRERLIPEYLKQAPTPYATGCFGKWNIGFAPGSRPTERGFDEFIGHASGNMDYYHHNYRERHDLYHGTEPLHREGDYASDIFAEAAIDFIQRHSADGRPWFCYLPFNAPHFPTAGNKRPGQPNIWQAPDWAFEAIGLAPDEQNPRKRYEAVVYALDRAIGRVLDALDATGQRDATFVFFMSDNGAFRLNREGLDVGINDPLRSGGVTCWEGGLRVPAMARWPGKIDAGSVIDEPCWSPDLLIAAARLSETALPEDIQFDGRDPIPLLTEGAPSAHASFFFSYRKQSALRRGDWKIIREQPDQPWQLYNLQDDVAESRNLAGDSAETVERLVIEFEAWQDSFR